MTKTIHIYLKKRPAGKTKDAKVDEYKERLALLERKKSKFDLTTPASEQREVEQEIKQLKEKIRNWSGSLDAGFTTYDPREVNRLRDEIKEIEQKLKGKLSPFAKQDLEQVKAKLEKELSKYRTDDEALRMDLGDWKRRLKAKFGAGCVFQEMANGEWRCKDKEDGLQLGTWKEGIGVIINSFARDEAKTEDAADALTPAEQSELSTLQQAMEKLDKEIERKEDQGVTVLPADRQKLAEMARKIHQLTMKGETKDASFSAGQTAYYAWGSTVRTVKVIGPDGGSHTEIQWGNSRISVPNHLLHATKQEAEKDL